MSTPKVKKWVLSAHAVQRMQERNISVVEISELIAHPDFTIAQGTKWIFGKEFPNRTDNKLAAVLIERRDKDLWLVISVLVRFKKTR